MAPPKPAGGAVGRVFSETIEGVNFTCDEAFDLRRMSEDSAHDFVSEIKVRRESFINFFRAADQADTMTSPQPGLAVARNGRPPAIQAVPPPVRARARDRNRARRYGS